MGWIDQKLKERGRRALRRQLDYQKAKAAAIDEKNLLQMNFIQAQQIRQEIANVRVFSKSDKILEVGSGAHGLVFGWAEGLRVGIDPLAVEYRNLFPGLQGTALTIAAIGEQLPFDDTSFDVVISDNVIDHAERPINIVDEIVRVLKPGGVLFFAVNVHHPVYDLASRAHGIWNAIGLKVELSAFADHTVHFTEKQITSVFQDKPIRIIEKRSTVEMTRATQRAKKAANPDELLKKLFFKNAQVVLFGQRM